MYFGFFCTYHISSIFCHVILSFHPLPPLSRKDLSASLRCINACQPSDIQCIHLITHTALSLPTFRDFSEPEGKT